MNGKKHIDLRSDTVTQPTDEMRDAMCSAPVGDDVYGEDPTVNALEERAAELVGMEAAIFVPTGTMGNQIAIKVHTLPGSEVILEGRSHIYDYELGMLSDFSGVMPRVVAGENDILSPESVKNAIRPDIYYVSKTGLICLENTVNMAGGRIYPMENIKSISSFAGEKNIPVHLDGARIFNAAVASECSVKDISKYFDSVMFCLSKGLCAPVGSMLAGSREFIAQARAVRKKLGGGMRQAGIIAAAGLVSLNSMTERLFEDHENATLLAEGLSKSEIFTVNPETVQTNIVIAEVSDKYGNSNEVIRVLGEHDILLGAVSEKSVRFVTHNDISKEDVEKVIDVVGKL